MCKREAIGVQKLRRPAAVFNAEMVAKVLGVSPSSGYELMHEDGFPVLRVGSRMVVPKDAFIRWVESHTGGVG